MAHEIRIHNGTPRGRRVGAWTYASRIEALDHAARIDAHRTREEREEHPLSEERVTTGPSDAVLSEEQTYCAETERDMGHDAGGWRY